MAPSAVEVGVQILIPAVNFLYSCALLDDENRSTSVASGTEVVEITLASKGSEEPGNGGTEESASDGEEIESASRCDGEQESEVRIQFE